MVLKECELELDICFWKGVWTLSQNTWKKRSCHSWRLGYLASGALGWGADTGSRGGYLGRVTREMESEGLVNL